MFSERLKLLRTKRGLSQQELADALMVARSTIASYEVDDRRPDHEMTQRIAEFFRVSIDYLYGRTDDPSPVGKSQAAATEEQVEAFFRGEGLTPGDLEIIRTIREQRRRENEKRGPRPKPEHPF